jgi:peptidoglycan/xylan/chitin deacetylase (PgdA/CDA1 family)
MSIRFDRFVSLYIASPLIGGGTVAQRPIPILMYHSIADENESAGAYYRIATRPEVFRTQMRFLSKSGYQTCTLSQACSILDSSEPTGRKVVVTFDDGYSNFYMHAFPILQEFGFTATMFLPTAFIGEAEQQFKGRDCLTWSNVREMQKFGISFGSHTVSHPQLYGLNRTDIERELTDSKKAIDDNTGYATESFAYPYAFPQVDAEFKKIIRESLQKAGYRNGTCTTIGRASASSDPFFLERLPLNDLDDEALLRAKLEGAYDWMGTFQSLIKRTRSRRATFRLT